MTVPKPTIADLNATYPPLSAADPDTQRAAIDGQCMMLESIDARGMPIWTVYHDTADLPGIYSARLFMSAAGGMYVTGLAVTGATLEDVRGALPPGLIRFAPDPADDPKIVETWL